MNTEQISVKASISADKQKVWEYYTTPEHITNWNFADPSWHCADASNEVKVGGRYHARMEARDGSFGFDFDAVYQEVNPGESFCYEFGGRTARVSLSTNQEGTELTVIFDPEHENPVEFQRDGWQAILNNFKKYTEGI